MKFLVWGFIVILLLLAVWVPIQQGGSRSLIRFVPRVGFWVRVVQFGSFKKYDWYVVQYSTNRMWWNDVEEVIDIDWDYYHRDSPYMFRSFDEAVTAAKRFDCIEHLWKHNDYHDSLYARLQQREEDHKKAWDKEWRSQ